MKQLQHFFYLFLLVFLTACDGDSFSGQEDEVSIDLEATTTVELTINNTYVDAANPAIVTAKVQSDDGAVDNVVVTFSSEIGLFDIESSTALTNSDGIATIGLTAGAIEGAGTITASIETGEFGTIGFESAGDGIDPFTGQNQTPEDDVVLVNVIISSPQVSASSPQTVTANVSDVNGPVQGTVVTFSASTGYLSPASGTALTNSSGDASILINADNVEGAGTVSATTANGESAEVGFSNAGDGGVIAGKQVKLSLSSNQISSANPATVMVTVTDENGVVSGEVVNFSSTIGVLNPYSGTALTDATGVATITLMAGNVEGAGLISATLSTGEFDSLGFATTGDASDVAGNEVTITASITNISNGSPSILTATVTNAGNPVAGDVVNFSSTLGALSPISGTALTNASGQAIITLSAGTNAGAGVASVTLDNGATAKVGFETAGDESADLGKTIIVTPITALVENIAPVTITVKVTDNGVGVANEVINFTTTLGAFNPLSGTALTNSAGDATIELTAGSVEGAGIVTATLSSGESDTSGFATKGDSNEVSGKVVIIDPIVGSITNLTPATINVLVTDNGQPVANEVVNFSSSLGVFDPVSASALTDGTGKATILLTAGNIQGAGLLTATVSSGELDSTGFATAGDAPLIQGKEVSVEVINKTITAANNSAVRAYVTENSVPVANEVVNFASTLGLLNPLSGTALTDALGFAEVTLSAGTVEGAGIATATLSNGATASDSFATAGDDVIGVYIEMLIVEPDTTTPIDTINTTTPGQVIATVHGLDAGEKVLVTFSSDIGEIPIPTAITDSVNNRAIVDIYAGNDIGAGTVTATLRSGEVGEELIIVGAAGLDIGSVTLGSTSISAGGSTNVTVTIVDTNNGNAPYTEPVVVNFSSVCSLNGKAILDEQVATFQGTAISSYLAAGCEGADIITVTANAGSETLSEQITITVESADEGSIEFVSVSNANLALKGAGTSEMPEYSTVIFRVLDVNGLPAENKLVDFSLNTNAGGITLNPPQGETNSEGYVQVVVNSGTIATPVRVTASVNSSDPLITTQSSLMVISTGIADQDSFSISADVYNIEGYSIDGTVSNITARLADGFNNPVPDGTAVSFTAEGGVIQPSCTTKDGICSVEFASASPRPLDYRVTIMAHAVGEESFSDLNGNGRFDAGEEVTAFLLPSVIDGKPYDLPEAFVDNNENGTRDTDEEFYDFIDPISGTPGTYDGADTFYNGSLCSETTHPGCTDQKSIHVRGDLVIVLSGSAGDATVSIVETVDSPIDNNDSIIGILGETIGRATVLINGPAGQPLPAGTALEFITSVGSIAGENQFVWPNENTNSGRLFSIEIKGEDTPKTGSLSVKIITPSGNQVVHSTGITVQIL